VPEPAGGRPNGRKLGHGGCALEGDIEILITLSLFLSFFLSFGEGIF
jgi:hypothetical protein